jgi:putative transposase
MNAIPRREQQEVATELAGIFKQEKKEDALLNLAASTRQIPQALS